MPKKSPKKQRTTKPMTRARAIEVLTQYNLWRKGIGPYSWDGQSRDIPPSFFDAYSTKEIDAAIAYAIRVLKSQSAKRPHKP